MSSHPDARVCQASHYSHVNYADFVPMPTVSDSNRSSCLGHQRASTMTTAIPPVTALNVDATQETLLTLKTRLLGLYNICLQPVSHNLLNRAHAAAGCSEAAQLRKVDVQSPLLPTKSAFSPTECNKQTSLYVEEVAGGGGAKGLRVDWHEPIAANQDAVDLFFLEGSRAVDGLCFSPYPIYGSRTAEERHAAVCEVFRRFNVVVHLPTSSAALATAQCHDSGRYHSSTLPLCKRVTETREQYWRRLSDLYIKKGVEAAAAATTTAAKSGAAPAAPAYEPEDPFYMIDLGRVVEQMARWRHELPMVRPYFAVKSNPNVAILELLAALGAGFDCASKEEIRLLLNNHLVESPDDIIFANPCKQLGDMREANACGVTYVTVDNQLEIEKISRMMPLARAIIRIKTNDSQAQCSFSTKFGASLDDVDGLLQAARQFNVDVYGVSFHVGSGNGDCSAYVSALRDAHSVFQKAARYGFNCTVLDIGGGFPGMETTEASGETSFETIAGVIRPMLEELFGSGDVTIISEPGRYFTAATHALVMNVFAARKRRMSDEEKLSCQALQSVVQMDEPEEYQYYVNDGLYHSFNCILYDHAHPKLLLLNDDDGADGVEEGTDAAVMGGKEEGETSRNDAPSGHCLCVSAWDRRRSLARRPLRFTTIFGPTCDSLDCILEKQPFPELKLGDWLLVPNMGSYTTAASSSFNGFSTRRLEWVSSVSLHARIGHEYAHERGTLSRRSNSE
ncbi:hypothetical protein JIQ42_08333 [Leishmania sp. Namibia]|uniref:hypothetical protein n=1 Tax=Leishmania sp. Namibia TaxID=2802991 RepID=UPI001B620844|nr:hypothetical protein JIQ42_08333 [Leishmania sp. Namibia]